MPCYHPLEGWRSRHVNVKGKRSIVFSIQDGLSDERIQIPCGQCIGCRLERSRQWAVRCVLESSLYDNNCFITLTYDDAHLPYDRSLNKKDWQLFMKRLRKKYSNKKIRFYMCGEYGEEFSEASPNGIGRPHYHACLFNHDFCDKELWSIRDDVRLYRSQELESLWKYGFSTIGDVTFESAAYIARYVVKKINGKKKDEHYKRIDTNTGEILDLMQEFNLMSRKPGLANDWFNQYRDDLRKDYFTIRGVKQNLPKYFDQLIEGESEDEIKSIKENRKKEAWKYFDDNSLKRLKVKEKIKHKKSKLLIRSL